MGHADADLPGNGASAGLARFAGRFSSGSLRASRLRAARPDRTAGTVYRGVDAAGRFHDVVRTEPAFCRRQPRGLQERVSDSAITPVEMIDVLFLCRGQREGKGGKVMQDDMIIETRLMAK